MSCEDSITYEQLVEGLLEFFDREKESIVIEDVQAFINRLGRLSKTFGQCPDHGVGVGGGLSIHIFDR